jgi:hypothetical protein
MKGVISLTHKKTGLRQKSRLHVPLPIVPGALYTPAEAERATRRSHRHLKRRQVPHVRDGRRLLYRGEDLIAYVNRYLVTASDALRPSVRAQAVTRPRLGGRPSSCFRPTSVD